jgi:hypothetical protein
VNSNFYNLLNYKGKAVSWGTILCLVGCVPESGSGKKDCFADSSLDGFTDQQLNSGPVTGISSKSFKITPSLPDGLSFDTSTGLITGQTSAAFETTFTIESQETANSASTSGAQNNRSSCEFSVKLTAAEQDPEGESETETETESSGGQTSVAPLPTPAPIQYSNSTIDVPLDYTIEERVLTYTPSDNLVFSSNPALPAGLTLNSVTGSVTGRPTSKSILQYYTITGTRNDGQTVTTPLSIAVYNETLDFPNMATSSDTLARASGGGAAEIVGDYLYLIGGAFSASPWGGTNSTHVQRASLTSPTVFTNLGSVLPTNTAWHDSMTIGDYVYSFGTIYGTRKTIYRAPISNLSSWTLVGNFPGDSGNNVMIRVEDTVFHLGVKLHSASISDLSSWVDYGVTAGVSEAGMYFEIEHNVYSVTGTNIYVASKQDLTSWTSVSPTTLPGSANNGSAVVIGNKAFILGSWNTANIFSANILAMDNWSEEAFDLPRIAWGMNSSARIGNTLYMYGGLNMSYTGMTHIVTIPIVKSYTP